MRVLLVSEEIAQGRKAGYLVYLQLFMDYLAARRIDTTVLVTGHRFEALLFRTDLSVRGRGLVRLGRWYLVVDPAAWRHALYALIMRSGRAPLRRLALFLRRAVTAEAAIIGRRLSAAEAAALAATIRAVAPDLVFVNTIFAAAILDVLPPGTRAAVITHDVFYQRTASLQARHWVVIPAVARAEEAAVLRRFDAIIAISAGDAAAFHALAPDRPVLVVSPPIVSQPATPAPDATRCVFLGSGSTHNVDGVKWLLTEVWPQVRARNRQARLELCGAVCDAVADHEGVIRRHIVADLAAAFTGVGFAVNPLRAGSGLNIKMLDYFAHGVPAITTSIGAQGFPRTGAEPFVVCDEPEEFAATMVRWINEPELVAQFAARCAGYAGLFSRDAAYAELDRLIGGDALRA